MKFRLLAGMHIQADKTQEPVAVKDPTTGVVTQRYPSKTYKQGEIVESDKDLVAKLGHEKFQLVDKGSSRKGMSVVELMKERDKINLAIAEASRGAPSLDAKDKEALEKEEAANALLNEGEVVEDDDDETPKKKPNGFKDQLPEDLDSMTVAELKEYAEAEEIDISGLHLKADIVEAIKSAKS